MTCVVSPPLQGLTDVAPRCMAVLKAPSGGLESSWLGTDHVSSRLEQLLCMSRGEALGVS